MTALFETVVTPHVRSTPGAPAIRTLERAFPYAQFDADIRRAAHKLAELDAPERGLLLIDVPGLYATWVFALAAEAVGLAFVAAPPAGADAAYLEALSPDVLLTSRVPAAEVPRVVPYTRALLADLQARPPADPPPRSRLPDDPLMVFYTSGTTGEPKRTLFTRRVFALREAQKAELQGENGGEPPRPVVMLTMGPQVASGREAIRVWSMGGTLCEPPVGAGWRRALDAFGLDVIHLPPVELQAVLRSLGDAPLLKPLRISLVGGTPSAALIAEARARIGEDIFVKYGATEVGPIAGAPISRLAEDPAVCGFVREWAQVEILGPDGAVLPPGERGELRIRSTGMVQGYPDEPDAPQFRDGWFHPGDLASVDANNVLRVHGRLDELLHLGGAKVLPSVIEAVALRIDGVTDCAAFAAPDGQGLDAAFIAVVAAPDFDPAPLGQALLREFGRPVAMLRIDAVPRNAMGKVERPKLREAMIAKSQRSGGPGA